MDAPVTEILREAEEDLRSVFGTEDFKLGKHEIEMRTSGGDASVDFDETGPKKSRVRINAVVFKDDFPGRPVVGLTIIWKSEGEDIKMKIQRVRGIPKSEAVWTLELGQV